MTVHASPITGSKILIIGNGAVATHWERYLTLLNSKLSRSSTTLQIQTWDRKKSKTSLIDNLHTADLVFLAIKDDQLESFLTEYQNRDSGTDSPLWIHFSATFQHPHCYSLHWLGSFSKDTLYDLEAYQQLSFIIRNTEPLAQASWLKLFPNKVHSIKNSDKDLYHALAVLSGNFVPYLLQHCLKEFENLGVSEETVKAYLQHTLNRTVIQSGEVSGPLARKDIGTLIKHCLALEGRSMEPIYKSFLNWKGISL